MHDASQMKTATVRDLRYAFPRVSRWIQQGESVEITFHGKKFATLTPTVAPRKAPLQWPDFEGRLKRLFPKGVKGQPASEIILESRQDR
jgi:antitoxin (DNA-binding transcriptional repressor) of toxin-antitoxin stability system